MVFLFNISIDKIYCISLRNRHDRRILCQKEFNNVGLTNVHYHIVDPHPINGCYGCAESHIQCVQDAKNNNYENVLIFEDDVCFVNNAVGFLNNKSISIPNDYLFFYLGGNLWLSEYYKINIMVAKLIQATHAYVINNKIFDIVLKHGPMQVPYKTYPLKIKSFKEIPLGVRGHVRNWIAEHKSIDAFYARIAYNEKKSYCLYPMIAHQSDSFSNLLQRNVSPAQLMIDLCEKSISSFKCKLIKTNIFNISVDKIYCISLREREDDRKRCQNEFNKIGFVNVQYHLIDKHHENTHGYAKYHIECIKDAKNHGYENILIFEDNVCFINNAINIINNKTIKIPDDYLFFYLGGSLRTADYHSENIIHALLIQTSHAYILNKKAFDIILKYEPINTPVDNYLISRSDYIHLPIKEKYLVQNIINKSKMIDCFYAKIAFNEKKSYVVYPMICYQKDNYEYMYSLLNNSIGKFKNKLNNLLMFRTI